MSEIAQGRQDLARWRASIPDDFFACDANLQRVLRMYDPGCDSYEPALRDFGRAVATIIDPAATINDRPDNHPRLEAWDGIGQRTEQIEFHPSYHTAGRSAGVPPGPRAPRPGRVAGRGPGCLPAGRGRVGAGSRA